MTNEPRETGRREANKGTSGRGETVLRRKAREKQELVIPVARSGPQSFDGLNKVDDRDDGTLAACLNHKTPARSSEDSCNNGVSDH